MFERWLGRRPELEDRVWRTSERKLEGVAAEARVDGLTGVPSLVVYHFAETAERLERRLVAASGESVLALRAVLPADTRCIACVALDEAWLRDHVGESTGELLERLGMDEDEVLSHPMIGKALRRTQNEHEARRRPMEQPARSAEEWMRVNLTMR